MLSSDLIYFFLFQMLQKNQFGNAVISQKSFLKTLRDLSIFIASNKIVENIRISSSYFKENFLSLEIYRQILFKDSSKWNMNQTPFNHFFSTEAMNIYLKLFENDNSNTLIIKHKQVLSFVLSNSKPRDQYQTREEILKLMIRRQEKFYRFLTNRKKIKLDRIKNLMEFYDKEDFFHWLKANSYEIIPVEENYVLFNKLPKIV